MKVSLSLSGLSPGLLGRDRQEQRPDNRGVEVKDIGREPSPTRLPDKRN